MMITVRCPHCSRPHDVPEGSLGKPSTCQGCGQSFTLAASHDETVAYVKGQASAGDSRAKSPAPLPVKIGRYEVRERLGAGVFGTVYRAYDSVLDRDVALKLPRSAALESADARERFLREARAAARLRHPHIVPVYDCGQDDDEVFIVSAFIEGQTLAAAIAAGQIDHRRAVGIAAKLAHALGTAHQAGIVHRDVKPANVMLDDRGEPQLTDFGLAQLSSSASQLTQQGMLLGTPAYMSPEQALGDPAQIGPESDQYGLGVLLYEMLCRRLPFEGPPLTVLYRLREETPAPPRSIDPAIPPALEAICLKAMAKRPADRFADCAELSDALRQVDFNAGRAEKAPEGVQPQAPMPGEVPAKPRETAKEPMWQKSSAPAQPGPSGGSGGGSGGGEFDPYHKWLAIPLNERPPTHYQILGVTPSESDRDVINMAALQRSAYVRNFQSGKQSEQATRILNEIGAALACLLDPAKRAAYDAELRKARPRAAKKEPTAAARAPATQTPAAFSANSFPLDDALLQAAAAAEPLATPAWMLPPPRRRTGLPWWGVASAVGGVAVLVLMAMIALSGGDPPPSNGDGSQAANGAESASSSAAVAQGDVTQGEAAADAAATNPQPETASSTIPPPTTVAAIETDDLDGQQGSGSPDQPVIATNAIGMTLVLIPAGEFDMGSPPDEADRQGGETLHHVRLTKDFYLGRHEVTVGQFRRFVYYTGYKSDAERTGQGGRGYNAATGELELGPQYTWQNPGWAQTDDHPVLNVSWNDAQEFLRWLTGGRPRPYRLPTEAEWEYACRAGTTTAYATGDDRESLVVVANIPDASAKVRFPSWKTVGGADGHVFTAPVGSLQPNGFGLADMHGNVGEWCADWYGPYPAAAVVDPTGPSTGTSHVLRGGGWSNFAPFCRSACRNQDFNSAGSRFNSLGFRVARDAGQSPEGPLAAEETNDVESLFNGSTLQGWEGDPSLWKVENGAIVGRKPAGAQGDAYLMTQASFENFVLTTKFHLLEGNSGIQFRGEPAANDGMTGYSADLAYHDNFKYLGTLFLVGQQGPCASPSEVTKRQVIGALGDDGWNEYRVTANGNHIVLEINGVEVVNTTHAGPARGRIGFQLHGGTTATRVEFKDIQIRELPEAIADEAPAAPPQLVRLDELNTSGWDAFAWVSPDGGSIYWEANTTRAPIGMQIWHAERPDPSSRFDNKRALFQGRQPALTPDEKQIVFVRVGTNGQERLYMASRQSRSDAFGAPQEFTQFTGYVGYNNPWISPDGLRLHVNAVSADNTHRYLVLRRGNLTAGWSAPGALDVRWDLARQRLPLTWLALSTDELSLLATHEGTVGQWRVVRFTRAGTDEPFVNYEYLTLPGVGQVFGKAPRYVAATRELHLTLKPDSPGTTPGDPADLGVIRNVGVEAVYGSEVGATSVTDNEPDRSSTRDGQDGFRFLFNGTDLSGWRVVGGSRSGWVRNGVLASDGGEGNLATEAEYSDFELALDFRVGRDANSGVILRAADGDTTAKDYLEVQILDDLGPKFSAMNLKPEARTGSLFGLVPASPPGSVPSGLWQTMVVRCDGPAIKVTLNDLVCLDANLENYRSRAQQFPAVNRRRGHIMLQHHTGRVEFRNIRIRVLAGP